MRETTLMITADGQVKFVWEDGLAALCDEGKTTIQRVADVEPNPYGPGWIADCSRIGGGTHGPYPLRQTALDHERAVVEARLWCGLI